MNDPRGGPGRPTSPDTHGSDRSDGDSGRTVKHAVALVIAHSDDADRVLIVQRPDDDEDLPGVWGLPATSLTPGEDWRAAALRAGREKLGVQLAVDDVLHAGTRERTHYTLDMQLVRARIAAGTPDPRGAPVPRGSTRYQAWRWGTRDDVRPAAERGSLCSRLYLELAVDNRG